MISNDGNFVKFKTLFNSSSRRADKINLAPRFANSMAKDSPIPDEAPVIQITLSLNVFILFF